jgi:hypothetical protein
MRVVALVTQGARVEVPMSGLLATATVAEMATLVRAHATVRHASA